jgi:YD repeat-containing protein
MTTNDDRVSRPFVTGDMYSTAFQFYSHINPDVDPRTGMYSASVDLATGEGNRLRGPHFPFRLSYSAVDTIDDGFGIGWRLGLTELDLTTSMLTLSSGDSHKVDELYFDELAVFPDRKLDSCSLIVTGTSQERAVVEHVTGVIEYLEALPSQPTLLRPVRIVNPSGDAIRLVWTPNEIAISRLTSVVDNDGEELLRIDYGQSGIVKVTIHLANASHRRDMLPLEMHFGIPFERLESITIPVILELNADGTSAGDEATWKFDYYNHLDTMTLLTSVTSPDGLRDAVEYNMDALKLPEGGPMLYMPAVALRTRSVVVDSTNVIRESSYQYGDGKDAPNFYGYPIVDYWEGRSDQLLHKSGADGFIYTSTETQRQDGVLLCTIERKYNHLHLITNETTTRGSVVQSVTTKYGDAADTSFEDQKASFQLPHVVRTTCYDTREADIEQETWTESAYDNYGNVLSRYDSATDTTETSLYYAIEGEMLQNEDGTTAVLCPPDPMGKVRRLKRRTTRPGGKGGPVRSTQYRYTEVPARGDGLRDRTYYVQASEEISTAGEGADETILVRSVQTFITDLGDQHGSLEKETREQDGLVETRSFTYVTDDAGGTVTTTTRHTSNDGVENITSETLHLISGLVKSTVDALDNHAEFTYDALGRRTSEVLSPRVQDYEVTTRWNYQLSMKERWVERIGITGLPHRVWMDEQGRAIKREEPLPDGLSMTVHELEYDGFGQLVREVQSDVLRDLSPLALETRYEYDDWGRCSLMTSPDGSRTVSETRLTREGSGDETEVFTQTLQWQVYGPDNQKTGWRSTYLDVADRQRRAEAGTWSETDGRLTESTTTWEYDGVGRCISMKDPLEKVTLQTWDVYDRLIRTDLPDGTAVLRTYAPGHEDEFIAELALVPPANEEPFWRGALKDGELKLGSRTWDGLGRLKTEKAGSLASSYGYKDGQMSADTRTLPNGLYLQMQYDLRLRETLLGSTLNSQDGSVLAELTAAEYDKQLGLPTLIRADGGEMTITPDYLGRMTRQTIRLNGDEERACEITVSPGGLALEKTGTDGVRQVYDFDGKGRLKSVEDDDVRIDLAYDDLSRTISRTTRSVADDRSVTQSMIYDARGRISEQAWSHDDASGTQKRRLVFTWRGDDKVSGREWFGGDETLRLRKETMDYDDRGRLVLHEIDALEGEYPVDEMGNPYVRQAFVHDCLDNLRTVTTTLLDERVSETTYTYDVVDLDRLATLANTLDGYPGSGGAPLSLTYDSNGNLTDDGQGRKLEWDGAGRLSKVIMTDGEITYIHGPDGRVSSVTHAEVTTYRYREDSAIAFEVDKNEGRRYIRTDGGVVAETRLAGAIRETFLLGTDPQGSVVTESEPATNP